MVGQDRPRNRVSPPQLHGEAGLGQVAARLRAALLPGERLAVQPDRLVIEGLPNSCARDRMLELQSVALGTARRSEPATDGRPIVLGTGFSLRRGLVSARQEASDYAQESLRAADQMIRPDVLRPGRRTSPGRFGTPLQVIAAFLLSFALPFGVLLLAHGFGWTAWACSSSW